MGRITVTGSAKKEFMPDKCRVSINIDSRKRKASEASKATGDRCELLLAELKKIGISPDKLEVSSDSIQRYTAYDSNKITYESSRQITACVDANIKAVNAVRGIIENGFDSVTLETNYYLSNADELRKELLKDAIADARSKAELMALATGCSITGIASANITDDPYDYYPLVDYASARMSVDGIDESRPLSNELTIDKITLSAVVKVVWRIE